jgi:hypothetical protein
MNPKYDKLAAIALLVLLLTCSALAILPKLVKADSGPPNPFNVRVEYCKVVSEGGWFVICVFHPANMTALGLNLSNLVLIDRLDQADRTYFVVQAPLINGTEKFLYPCVVVSRFKRVIDSYEIKHAWLELPNGTWAVVELCLPVYSNQTETSRIWLDVQVVKFPILRDELEPHVDALIYPAPYPWWIALGAGGSVFTAVWMFSFTIHSFFFWLSVVIELCLLYLWWKKEPIEDLWLSWVCILLVFLLTREPIVRLFGVDFPIYISIFVAQLPTVIPYINSKRSKPKEVKSG